MHIPFERINDMILYPKYNKDESSWDIFFPIFSKKPVHIKPSNSVLFKTGVKLDNDKSLLKIIRVYATDNEYHIDDDTDNDFVKLSFVEDNYITIIIRNIYENDHIIFEPNKKIISVKIISPQ